MEKQHYNIRIHYLSNISIFSGGGGGGHRIAMMIINICRIK